MLSRVAAVEAPRTDYRRRVAGSSGRRREGRESEPQRPKMSRHLLYSAVLPLLFMMMCCCTCGAAAAGEAAPAAKFLNGKRFFWREKNDEETVSSLRAPSLVEMNGKVFAVAEAQCKKGEDTFTGIASQLLKQGSGVGKEGVLKDANTKTKVLEEGASEKKEKVDVSRPTTVVQGNGVYMLVGKCSRAAATDDQESGADDSGLLLVKGDVNGDESNEQINWEDPKCLPRRLFGTQHECLTQLIGSGGSGVKMKDGTLVFPAEAKKKQKDADTEKEGKTVSLIIYTLKDNAASWKLSKGMSDDGCSDPSVVEWKDDKLMMMTACDDGRRRVYESGDKGDPWTEALGTLSRVWSSPKDGEGKAVRSGFITAKIEDRDVMLVTLPVYSSWNGEENGKGELHLWLTDNTHIIDIGPVSEEDEEEIIASSLLYKSDKGNNEKEELIALYERKKGDGKPSSYGMVSVLLTEQLKRVKEVLATWKEVDEIVSKLCPSGSTEKSASTDNACSAVRITDGLVGFLSGNFSNKTWRDEYLGVNATVKGSATGVTKTSDGVKFQGAWAEWPVGAQGENQLYHFANHNFTLVATVSIDNVPEEFSPISVMGMKMNGAENTVLLRLSYNSGVKWKLSCGGETLNELSSTWESEETHQLAIVLQNGTHGSAYVDGQPLGEAPCALENKDSKVVSHFYIGGDGGSTDSAEGQGDVSVTVTNVLLYNRPLSSADITALNTKLSISKQKDPQAVTGDARAPEVREPPAPVTVPQTNLGAQEQGEQELLKTSKVADSHGVSTSTVLTATTSSGEEGSVNQLSSGTSSEGTQTVHGASSFDFNPTVGTEAGGKTQEDEPHKTPAGNVNAADANAPTTMGEGQDGPAVNLEASARSGGNGETAEETNGQEEKQIHPHDGEANATALSSSLGNVAQGNNSDAGAMRESGLLPLLLLLGLWGFAAL
ncbi:putative trans-sialidase, Group V [Trypanosoma cruzi]|uniref:Trans-sialidase, putative n=2 Tax=Trypanosoma cruzi TaxID=5693 RepID=Q4DZY2_TRYCC|nr:trans-sialidase, putative [Trypanosoma cruzi]EAN98056.1 trans-sialidase, putative [Trypanosoma cruzi]PWV10843.1 putative trans-sialidase, Group V [Trypanosoma cruzi]|eukprot:XP_819907.1 trans-sialidase [Trypanosoma cruzi strain CL Brener]